MMVTTLTIEQTTDMIIKVCEAIIESKPMLTDIDSKIGDGDHGIGMALGMEKAKDALNSKRPFPNINLVFQTTGMEMLNSMGGASGVIFGSLFLGGIKGIQSFEELDGDMLTIIMRGSLETIKNRGRAKVGDKTMVDALEPAVIAMEQSDKMNLADLLYEAKEAAEKGVVSTKELVAKFGRAKSLMERAIGFQDAGATSVAIIFASMHQFIIELES